MAIFSEIFEMNDLPIKVSINEYIEISKYYSTKKSKMFVNGILDNVVKYYIDQGFLKKQHVNKKIYNIITFYEFVR